MDVHRRVPRPASQRTESLAEHLVKFVGELAMGAEEYSTALRDWIDEYQNIYYGRNTRGKRGEGDSTGPTGQSLPDCE